VYKTVPLLSLVVLKELAYKSVILFTVDCINIYNFHNKYETVIYRASSCYYVGFEVLASANAKIICLLGYNVMSGESQLISGGTYALHLQDQRVTHARKQATVLAVYYMQTYPSTLKMQVMYSTKTSSDFH
jgi:hypothetical protein